MRVSILRSQFLLGFWALHMFSHSITIYEGPTMYALGTKFLLRLQGEHVFAISLHPSTFINYTCEECSMLKWPRVSGGSDI